MSDWMDVLPCRGVSVEVFSQDEDVVLSTPRGPVSMWSDPVVGGWVVSRSGRGVAALDNLRQCLWLIIALYGEGECAWDELHKQLFGGE